MIVDCISDLHGHFPTLEGGDLLIVAGDLTVRDMQKEYFNFYQWASGQRYKKIIVVPGNHDNWLQQNGDPLKDPGIFSYLCDSGTEFEGLKIWGSPWTKTFPSMNPKCKAFIVDSDEELAEKWELIPEHTDILITHSPPYGILDKCENGHVGSKSLKNRIEKIRPEMVLFGHIHECGGQYDSKKGVLYINGSIVNEKYRVINNGRTIHFEETMPKMQRFKIIK